MPRPCVTLRRNRLFAPALLAPALLALVVTACGTAPVKPPNATHQAAAALNQSAARALAQGQAEEALAIYSRALALADSVEDFELSGTTLLNLALVHSRLGQLALAQARLDRILAAPQLYAGALQAQAAARKALLALDVPDQAAALRWADTALARCAEPCEMAAALANLRAFVALQSGDADAAAKLAERATELATAAGQEAEQANGLRLAGRAHSLAGRMAVAAEMLARALAIDRRLGLPDRVALDLMAAGENEARRGQREQSRAFFERALNVYLSVGNAAAVSSLRTRIEGLR